MFKAASKMATAKTAGSGDGVGSSVDSIGSSVDSVGSSVDSVGSSGDSIGSSVDSIGSSVDSVGSSGDSVGSSSDGGDSNSDGGNGGKQAATTTVCFVPLKTSENLVISLKCAIAIYLWTYTRKQNQHRCLTSHFIRSLVRHLETMVLQLLEYLMRCLSDVHTSPHHNPCIMVQLQEDLCSE